MTSMREMIDAINAAEPQPIDEKLADVDLMIGQQYELAKSFLIGTKDEQITPTFHVVAGNGQNALVLTPFNGEQEKEMVAKAMRRMMQEVNAIRYTFTSECWMAVLDKGEWEHDKRPPSQRDTRIEALVIVGCDDDRTSTAIYEIVRDDEGTITDLKRKDMGESMPEMGGRFVGLHKEEE
jgi:hypothetical protein